MSQSDQLQRFNQLAARGGSGLGRANLWPVSFTLSTDTASTKSVLSGSGSPAKRTRLPTEGRSGYIMRTVRTFMVLRSQLSALSSQPGLAIGTEFTLTADALNPVNVGTTWRCFELDDSNGGSELRAVCWRKDA